MQLSTFGRPCGEHDAMIGYRLDMVEITDPEVRASGQKFHPIVSPTGIPADEVAGQVRITPAELAAADDYEVSTTRARAVEVGEESLGTCAQRRCSHPVLFLVGAGRDQSLEQRRHQLSIRSHRHPRSHQGRARHVRPG